MADSHPPPPVITVTVDMERRPPSGKKNRSDRPLPLSSPSSSSPRPANDRAVGSSWKAQGGRRSPSPKALLGQVDDERRPHSSRSVGRSGSPPRSSPRGGGGGGRRMDCRPASARGAVVLDRRPHSSPARGRGSAGSGRRAAWQDGSRPSSSGTGRRWGRRPASSRSGSPRSHRGADSSGRIPVRHNAFLSHRPTSSARPKSSGQEDRPTATTTTKTTTTSRSPSSRGHRQGSPRTRTWSPRPGSRCGRPDSSPCCQNEAGDRAVFLTPRPQSPDRRESPSPPAPERRAASRGRGGGCAGGQGKGRLQRPLSSQVHGGGRLGLSSPSSWAVRDSTNTTSTSNNTTSLSTNTSSRGRRKERPWTAPTAGRRRCRVRDNLQDEGHYRAGGGDRPWLDPHQVSDETKRKQEQIIRRILEEFDLEETMTKYRNSNVVVCRREGKSLADFRFRSEMIRMMGSEEIRLNDQEWSRKFQRKMVEDYERLLDEQESSLAQAERQRLHRLRVEGVVPDAETAGSPEGSGSDVWVFKAQHSPPSLKKSRGRRPTGYGEKGYVKNKPIFADEGSDKWERTLHAQRQEKTYSPPEDVQTQVAHLDREERRGDKEPAAEREAGSEEGSAEGEEEEKDYMLEFLSRRRQTATEIERRERVAEQRKKRYQHLPPEVARLYYEETVTGLYRLAAELLSPESIPAPRDTVKGVKMAQS